MDLNEAIEEIHKASVGSEEHLQHQHQQHQQDHVAQKQDQLHVQQDQHSRTKEEPCRKAKAAAKSSDYRSVIEGLRHQGISLEDLASEILRLTAIDNEGEGEITNSNVLEEEEEEEKKRKMQEKQVGNTARVAPPLSISRPNHHHAESQSSTKAMVGVGVGIAASAEPPRSKAGASLSFKRPTVQKQPYNATTVTRQTKTTSSKLGSGTTPPTNDDEAHESSTHMSLSSSHGTEQPCSMTNLEYTDSAQVPSPTQLLRTQAESQALNPGAYSVCPSRQFNDSTASAEIDLESVADDTQATTEEEQGVDPEAPSPPPQATPTPTPATSNSSESQSEQGSNSSGISPYESCDSAALEAVPVDDIMTVKAEPVEDNSSSTYKIIAFVMGALVAIVVVSSLLLTANTRYNDQETQATISPTYNADTRFQLIQELLVEEFAPLYDDNYNSTNGTLVLQEAFLTATTPQYRALRWIARTDPELEVITRPFLEDFNDDDDGDTTDSNSNGLSLFGDDATTTHGGTRSLRRRRQRRRLQGTSISRDRIVQRYALAVLYFSTGNWTDSFEFLSAGHECDWSGALQCSQEGLAITHLDLHNNALEGTLPWELAALTRLQSLNLESNSLVGRLPPLLCALSELNHLDLGFNKLTGTIPEVYYKGWRQLESWSLAENDLTGTISNKIGNLAKLKTITWQRNHLATALPPEFWTQLTNMEVLDLSQQTGKFVNDTIGTEIGIWSNLRSLIFHGLELRGSIPSELGQLSLLSRLQIAANHLSGTIPSELGRLTAVTRLSLSLNAITGTVPKEFAQLSSLQRLYLQNTLLTGDVSFLCYAIDEGILLPMDPMRVDMGEVSGCRCCTCCLY